MIFGNVLAKKEAFLDNKNMYLICPKKIDLSLLFVFLLKIGPEMMFGDVLDRKEALQDNKNMYLICPKNRKFSKGVNP